MSAKDDLKNRIMGLPDDEFAKLEKAIQRIEADKTAPDSATIQGEPVTKPVLSPFCGGFVTNSESPNNPNTMGSSGGFVGFVGFATIEPFENNPDDLPPFDLEVLPASIADYVKALATFTETPIEMAGSLALSALSVAAQRMFDVEARGSWHEPLSIYMAVIADSGSRKSGVQRPIFAPIREYEKLRRQDDAIDVAMNRQEYDILNRKIANLNKLIADPKIDQQQQTEYRNQLNEATMKLATFQRLYPLRLIVSDTTYEQLTVLMQNNNQTMAIVSPEATLLTELRTGKYGDKTGGELDVFLKSHDAEELYIDRLTRESIFLDHPHMAISICSQPNAATSFATDEIMRDRGMAARFLYCPAYLHSLVGKLCGNPPQIPQEIEDRYAEFFFSLLSMTCTSTKQETLYLSSEADAVLTEYIIQIDRRMPNDLNGIQDLAGKMHGTCVRLAGLLHVAKQVEIGNTDSAAIANEPISVDTFRGATRLCDYFLEAAKLILLPDSQDQERADAMYIMTFMPTDGSPITLRALRAKCSRFKRKNQMIKDPQRFDKLVAELARRQYLRIEQPAPGKKGGRPSELVYANPMYFQTKSNTEK